MITTYHSWSWFNLRPEPHTCVRIVVRRRVRGGRWAPSRHQQSEAVSGRFRWDLNATQACAFSWIYVFDFQIQVLVIQISCDNIWACACIYPQSYKYQDHATVDEILPLLKKRMTISICIRITPSTTCWEALGHRRMAATWFGDAYAHASMSRKYFLYI